MFALLGRKRYVSDALDSKVCEVICWHSAKRLPSERSLFGGGDSLRSRRHYLFFAMMGVFFLAVAVAGFGSQAERQLSNDRDCKADIRLTAHFQPALDDRL